MADFQEVSGGAFNLNTKNLKKYAPFIAGGVILGLFGFYLKSKSSNSNVSSGEPDTAALLASTSAPTATPSSGSTPAVDTAFITSAFTQSINNVYKQTQQDLQNTQSEFRDNQATLSKELMALETNLNNYIQSQSVKSTSYTPAVVPTPTNTAANVTGIQNTTASTGTAINTSTPSTPSSAGYTEPSQGYIYSPVVPSQNTYYPEPSLVETNPITKEQTINNYATVQKGADGVTNVDVVKPSVYYDPQYWVNGYYSGPT